MKVEVNGVIGKHGDKTFKKQSVMLFDEVDEIKGKFFCKIDFAALNKSAPQEIVCRR